MFRNNSAMASHEVNLACNRIHEAIQKSGLHFVINQTPWSSYITIRRKLVFSKSVTDDVNVNSMEVVVNDELAALKDKNEQLVKKLANVELEKAETEEELEVTNQKYEKTVRHLHDRIEILATTLKEKELELNNQKCEILVLEKEKKLKNELIQNINEGFNKKLAYANAKVEGLKVLKRKC